MDSGGRSRGLADLRFSFVVMVISAPGLLFLAVVARKPETPRSRPQDRFLRGGVETKFTSEDSQVLRVCHYGAPQFTRKITPPNTSLWSERGDDGSTSIV